MSQCRRGSSRKAIMHEVSLMPWWWTVFLNVWAFAGPLVGIFVGAYLTSRWQRKQWYADHRIKEWRELLTALSNAAIVYVPRNVLGSASLQLEQGKINLTAKQNSGEILTNRIFIAEDVEELQLRDQRTRLLKGYDQTNDASAFGSGFRDWFEQSGRKHAQTC
jgi:hypothetical protein